MPDRTANFDIPYPVGADAPPDVPAHMKSMAESLDGLLGDIDPSQVIGGSAGELLVVQDTGAAAFKALSGDVTVDKAGVATIGAGKVGTTELEDLGVSTGKLANGGVTDGKVASANKDGDVATASMRTLGTGARQAAAGNDSRFPAGADIVAGDIASGAVSALKLATDAKRLFPQLVAALVGADHKVNFGTSSTSSGRATVTHGVGAQPALVLLTPHTTATLVVPSAGSATFEVTSSDGSAGAGFYWLAIS